MTSRREAVSKIIKKTAYLSVGGLFSISEINDLIGNGKNPDEDLDNSNLSGNELKEETFDYLNNWESLLDE